MFSIQSAGNRGIIIGSDRIDEQLLQAAQSRKNRSGGGGAAVNRAGVSGDTQTRRQPTGIRAKLHRLIFKRILRRPEEHESEPEEVEYQPSRYKPESLDVLCQRTKFSKKELQLMYRGFKQECPAGIVNEEMFTDIYAQFFPQGDSSSYARYVFNAFDKDKNGSISFEEFVVTLSTLCRGTLEDKLRWAFALYDVNGDGIITHDEMVLVVASIYEMMGSYTDPAINDVTVYQHVDSIYAKVGSTEDGHQAMTWEQFYDLCQKDERVLLSIAVFDTVM